MRGGETMKNVKKEYKRPELIVYGQLVELTNHGAHKCSCGGACYHPGGHGKNT